MSGAPPAMGLLYQYVGCATRHGIDAQNNKNLFYQYVGCATRHGIALKHYKFSFIYTSICLIEHVEERSSPMKGFKHHPFRAFIYA